MREVKGLKDRRDLASKAAHAPREVVTTARSRARCSPMEHGRKLAKERMATRAKSAAIHQLSQFTKLRGAAQIRWLCLTLEGRRRARRR